MGYYFSVAGPGAQVLSNGPCKPAPGSTSSTPLPAARADSGVAGAPPDGRGGANSIGYIEAEVQGGPTGAGQGC
jgi:hypothetical protein